MLDFVQACLVTVSELMHLLAIETNTALKPTVIPVSLSANVHVEQETK